MAHDDRRSVETIRALAQQLRATLGIEHQAAPDLQRILAELPKVLPEIRIEIVRELKGAAALAWVDSRGLSITKDVFEGLARGDARARFTIAHEIGHLVLHRNRGSRRLFRGAPDKLRFASLRLEREAMIFASEFLMPAALAKFQTVEEIERNFRVSRTAASIRFRELRSTNEVPLAPAVRARPDLVNELSSYGYSEKELSALVVPKRTLARRRADHELLTVEETDKALRLERIAALADKVFGDRAKAQSWLRRPKRSLSGDTPLTYLASETGARVVEEMLLRIEYGIFA